MEIFPPSLSNLLDSGGLPILLLFSLSLQLILIPMGLWRKYSSNNALRRLLCFAYLSADWAAATSLLVMAKIFGSSSEPDELPSVVWASFMLLHLGGSDTITAYSIEDNNLWARYFYAFLAQLGMWSYIIRQVLQPMATLVAIPIFLAAGIKYGERICVLKSASIQHLRDLLLSTPRFGHNDSEKPGNLSLEFPIQINASEVAAYNRLPKQNSLFSDLHVLHIAYCFFKRDKRLFADLSLNSYDVQQSLHYFMKFDSREAFKVIELELGFIYDFLYTKASVIHSKWGPIRRLTTLSSIVVAIAIFYTNDEPNVGYLIFFLFLGGALGLEICSFILSLCSDWSVIRLTKSSYSLAHLIFRAISHCAWSIRRRRWSNSVRQYNLISCCLKETKYGRCCEFFRTSCITKIMVASRHISDELKTRIFEQIKQKLEVDEDNRELLGWILRKHNCYNQLSWSLELDSDQSVLLWHIATHICYHHDHKTDASNSSVLEDSILLSDFLTYLLVCDHSSFPDGMGRKRFCATIDSATEFLQQRESIKTAGDACKSMLDLEGRVVDKDADNSVFFRGCRLAQKLQGLEECERWEIISQVWVEMLANISSKCRWYEHAKQLRHGGNLLTHVWLLMHHLGYIKPKNLISTMQDQEDTPLDVEMLDHVVDHISYGTSYGEGLMNSNF